MNLIVVQHCEPAQPRLWEHMVWEAPLPAHGFWPHMRPPSQIETHWPVSPGLHRRTDRWALGCGWRFPWLFAGGVGGVAPGRPGMTGHGHGLPPVGRAVLQVFDTWKPPTLESLNLWRVAEVAEMIFHAERPFSPLEEEPHRKAAISPTEAETDGCLSLRGPSLPGQGATGGLPPRPGPSPQQLHGEQLVRFFYLTVLVSR